ncbi:YveK family protein [Listeria rustica]|uniref:Polysaccharide chain length determinant N-terminal domain-containing protein n=1 Tax=Listeria rustica TaxID=2713503 RepID=A0A7W1T513_9LIST|nr:Wzz/FepE/Etk N-terminal domain-containing protein [Listeria rustica]MBA3925600.1 hypothetical protein [Listeria rustica]
MNNRIDLASVLNIIKRKFYILLICIAVSVAAIVGLTYMTVEPTYKASTEVLIEQSQMENNQQTQQDQTSTQLLNTYLVIIKSASITNEVASNLSFEMTPKQVSNSLTVENASGSKVISIIATASSPEQATEIVNETTEELKTAAPDILKNSSVIVLEKAAVGNSKTPVAPNYKTIGVLAVFLGLFVGAFIIYLGQLLNARIRTKDDVEALTDYPVLGKVSKVKKR